MKLMNLSSIFIISAIFLIPLVLSVFIKEIPNDVQPSLEGTQIIYKDLNVSQNFKSELDNLSGIGISIKNPYFRNHKNLTVNLFSEDKKILQTKSINGANIKDGDLLNIQFDTIRDSKNKLFILELVSLDTESNEAFEIFLTSKKTPWVGDLYINSAKQSSSLSLITYHRSNILTIPSGIFIQLFKRLFADLPFAIIYLMLIGILSVYLVKSNN